MTSPMLMSGRRVDDPVPADSLRPGDIIVEERERGGPTHTVVRRRYAGCTRYKVHIETVGGKNWCYDAQQPVTVTRS